MRFAVEAGNRFLDWSEENSAEYREGEGMTRKRRSARVRAAFIRAHERFPGLPRQEPLENWLRVSLEEEASHRSFPANSRGLSEAAPIFFRRPRRAVAKYPSHVACALGAGRPQPRLLSPPRATRCGN